MSTKTNTTATETKAAREAAEKAKLAKVEADLVTKYGDKIVEGSVRRAPEGSKYGTKCLVTIRTRGLDGKYDGQTREIATSDVFQVHHMPEVKAELKKLAAKEKREAKKAEAAKAESKPAKKGKAKKEEKAESVADALGV